MVEINWKKLILAAIAYTIVAQVIHTLEAFATMGYYSDPAFFAVWSKVMMPGPGAPPASFYIYSLVFGFITALIVGYGYGMVKSAIPGTGMRKGINYGLFLFFIVGIPYFLSTYLLINLPLGLLVTWLVSGLIIFAFGGIIFWKLLGE